MPGKHGMTKNKKGMPKNYKGMPKNYKDGPKKITSERTTTTKRESLNLLVKTEVTMEAGQKEKVRKITSQLKQ